MEDLTWQCMLCKMERPDDKISVMSKHLPLLRGVEAKVNVRYCNDKQECMTESVRYLAELSRKFRLGMEEDELRTMDLP